MQHAPRMIGRSHIVKLLALVIMLVCLASCRVHQQLPTDTHFHNRDSVRTAYVYDSVYIERERKIYIKGDTVFVKDSTAAKQTSRQVIHDSVYIHTVDTIYQPQPIKQEPQALSNGTLFLRNSGIALWVILSLLLLAVVLGIIIKFARR